ncbi:hypothetical protein ACSBR1_035078 [Camellia fascicularis]
MKACEDSVVKVPKACHKKQGLNPSSFGADHLEVTLAPRSLNPPLLNAEVQHSLAAYQSHSLKELAFEVLKGWISRQKRCVRYMNVYGTQMR